MEAQRPGEISTKREDVEQGPAKTQLGLGQVFRYSGIIGSQFYKLFSLFTCWQEASCSATGFTRWLLNPASFSHPYSWYWSWTKAPAGIWYIAAPYSYLWYILYSPALLGYLPMMLYLFSLDTFSTYLVMARKTWKFTIPFLVSSQFFLNYDPIDWFSFAFSVAGSISPIFSMLALLVKLPIGAPGYVWDFILHSPASISYWYNWPRYAWLAVWWSIGVLVGVRKLGLKAYILNWKFWKTQARKDFDLIG